MKKNNYFNKTIKSSSKLINKQIPLLLIKSKKIIYLKKNDHAYNFINFIPLLSVVHDNCQK